jgi:hypothetical protein
MYLVWEQSPKMPVDQEVHRDEIKKQRLIDLESSKALKQPNSKGPSKGKRFARYWWRLIVRSGKLTGPGLSAKGTQAASTPKSTRKHGHRSQSSLLEVLREPVIAGEELHVAVVVNHGPQGFARPYVK